MSYLERLNKLDFCDSDIDGEKVNYVLLEFNEKNMLELLSIGASEEDIEDMLTDDNDYLDITKFAFDRLGAKYFDSYNNTFS